jgi:predicted SAM-dependent methyltransferase
MKDVNIKDVKRVNVGAGPNCMMPDGWINVDIRKFPNIDKVMDVTEDWEFRELEYVLGEHFLEHLSLSNAIKFLSNAGNSLKVGGKIRLSTPNLEWVVKTHFDLLGKDEEKLVNDTLKTNRAFHGWGHHFLWSNAFLMYVLEEMGYENIESFKYGHSNDPSLNGLEKHSYYESGGYPCVIILEATKGNAKIEASKGLLEKINNEFIKFVDSGH